MAETSRLLARKASGHPRALGAWSALVGILLCCTDAASPSSTMPTPGLDFSRGTARTVAEVHQFGAIGDGVSDDSAAIQKAVESGAQVYLPAYYRGTVQRYLITRPINCVNRSGPTVFAGDELGEFDQHGPHGSTIIIRTGPAPAFDTSGSQDVEFRELSIVAMAPNASTIAIFEARSKSIPFAQNHRYQNVNIYLYSDMSANHGSGRIGIYNYGAELWSGYNVHIEADIPLYFSNENELGIQSSFAPLATGTQSMSAVTISGESSLITYGGPAIYLGGSDSGMFDFGQTFIAENATFRDRHSPFTIVARGRLRGLRYAGNVENLNQLLSLEDKASGLDLSGSIEPKAGMPIIALGANQRCPSISDSVLRVRSANQAISTLLIAGQSGKNCGIASSLVELPAGLELDVQTTKTQGDIVYGLGAENAAK